MMQVHRNRKGFALAELLIVIAIIGIIVAIVAPAGTGYTRNSRISGITGGVERSKSLIPPIMQGHVQRGLQEAWRH